MKLLPQDDSEKGFEPAKAYRDCKLSLCVKSTAALWYLRAAESIVPTDPQQSPSLCSVCSSVCTSHVSVMRLQHKR